MTGPSRLRELLASDALIPAPGAYDGLTARLVEQAGFPAAYMTGSGTAAAHGYPDYGLLTMTEMVENAGVLARSLGIPLIADADTGYGNELNVTRTVREYEMRGVAAIHLEDQVAPKRCGHLAGKEIVPRDEFIAKIRAAAAARRNPDFVLIARTDARAIDSMDEAIWRANAALAAGADVAFVEAVQSLDELRAVPRLVQGPCLLNMVKGGRTPEVTLQQARDAGYRIAIAPSLLLVAVLDACDSALHRFNETGAYDAANGTSSLQDRFRRFGADEWDDIRTRFRPAPQGTDIAKD